MTTEQKALMGAIHAAVDQLNGLTREAAGKGGIIVELDFFNIFEIGAHEYPRLQVTTSVRWPQPGEWTP